MTRRVGRRRWSTWAGAIAIGLVLAAALGLAISRREMRIVLSNSAAYPLTGVSIEYPGGTLDVGEIPSGTSFETSIWLSRPSGGRRAIVVRLVSGGGPPFEYWSDLGPVSFWDLRDFHALTMGAQFLLWEVNRIDAAGSILRGVSLLLQLD